MSGICQVIPLAKCCNLNETDDRACSVGTELHLVVRLLAAKRWHKLITLATKSGPIYVGRVTSICHKLAASSLSTTSSSTATYPLLRNISELAMAKLRIHSRLTCICKGLVTS